MSASTAPKEVTDRRYRLLPSVLEHVASTNPHRVYAAALRTSNLEDGLREFTFAQVLKAINAFANFLQSTIGISDCFETLTYVGVDDLRYPIFFFACIKTGHKALFVSPRNTAEQNATLTSLAQCKHLFYADEVASVAANIGKAAAGLTIHELKPFDHWLSIDSKPIPYTKTFEQARWDPVFVLHSSGSTGPPKLFTQNHQWLINQQKEFPGRPVIGSSAYDFPEGGYYMGVFPFFHLAGINQSIVYLVYSRSAAILLRPTDRPPTPELLLGLMRTCRVRGLALPPSVVEAIARSPAGMEHLAGLDFINFAGGPLEKSCGDRLARTVKLFSSYGTTEAGQVLSYIPTPADWEWFEFHPAHNIHLEEDVDGLYELVLYQDKSGAQNRGSDATILRTEPMWRSKDLFINDPQRPHLWKYAGRKDDIIVFSTGQKWNPVPTEGLVQTGTKASGVLIAGTGRTEPALLLETLHYEEDLNSLLNQVWPAIEDANSKTQRYGRISRSHIAFVKPGTFLRTGKNTIVRKTTLDLLAGTLRRLYHEDAGAGLNGDFAGNDEDQSTKEPLPGDLVNTVRECVHQVTTVSGCNDDEDLFVRGLDSLEAAEIARGLKAALRRYATSKALEFLDSSFVFQNSTIAWLAGAIQAGLTGISPTARGPVATFKSLLSKYQAAFEFIDSKGAAKGYRLSKIGITGSTGSLGSQILKLLIADSRVTQVVCLNRNASKASPSNQTGGDLSSKVSYMTVDFAKPNLDLSDDSVNVLKGLDAIIHCAWEVNFNRILATFETQIRALVDLIKISVSGEQIPRLFFISSISAVDENCPEAVKQGEAPEALVSEPENAGRMGYAVSKNLSEHLLSFAADRHGLPATVIRVGQIAGSMKPSDPAWNRKEWLPSLIDTSASLGCLPMDQPDVDWIPVDACAQTIFDIVGHDVASPDFKLYNVVNPQRGLWTPLARAIQGRLTESCKLVPLSQWIERLRAHDDDSESSLRKYPSLKLLPFFERSAMRAEAGRKVSTTKACAASKTLAGLSAISEEQMSIWMTQWGYGQSERV